MQLLNQKNSKKGFSLPVAMGVGIFLILIATSLIFITMNSISRTSSSLNSHQAYLNVKSALAYAQSYYSDYGNYSEITEEYMIMNDEGGTTAEGATISKNEADLENAMTYVIVKYIEAHDSDPASIKMLGIARYTDAFDKKPNSVRLSVSFIIGGTNHNIWVSTKPMSGPETYDIETDKITLNVKQPEDMNFQLSYYVWTYNDEGGAYSGYNESLGHVSYTYDESYIAGNSGQIRNLDRTLMKGNIVHPNGTWATGGGGKQGPPAIMANSGNGWFTGDYIIKSGRVPWFNIIFAQKGSVLGDDCSNTVDSQTNEMLHLWYLDPSDKNIYFEFLDKGSRSYWTAYYLGTGWNGKDCLDDTILVYVKNTKTTVHFRAEGFDDKNVKSTLASAPAITSVSNTDGTAINGKYTRAGSTLTTQTMSYEGCGWWTAIVDTGRNFNISISFNGVSYSAANVSRNYNSESWIVLKSGAATLSSHQSEVNALYAINVDPNSYVTVHAKIADYTQFATPKIGYKDVGLNSSAGKIALLNKVVEVSDINADDYTEESFAVLQTAKNEAIDILNDDNFINNQEGESTDEKITKADEAYEAAITKIDDAVKGLVTTGAKPDEIKKLQTIVEEANTAKSNQEKSNLYDYGIYQNFIKEGGAYDLASKALHNTGELTSSKINELYNNLREELDTLYSSRVIRDALAQELEKARSYVNDPKYKQSARDDLAAELDENTVGTAAYIYKLVNVTQTTINEAVVVLQNLIKACEDNPDTPLNTTALTANLNIARELLDAEKKNCTDATYTALENARNDAINRSGAAKTQEEINALNDAVVAAINGFSILKPVNTNAELDSKHTVRVWVVADANVTDFEFDEYVSAETTDPTMLDMNSLNIQEETGYRYLDVDKNMFQFIGLVATTANGKVVDSGKIELASVTDNNLVLSINKQGKTTKTTFTTIYGNFSGNSITAKIGTVSVNAVYEAPYYVIRYVTNTKNKPVISCVFNNQYGTFTTKTYTVDTRKAGEYVVTVAENLDDISVPVNVNDIYPKYESTQQPQTPNPEGTTSFGEFEVQNMASGGGSSTVMDTFDVPVPSGKTALIVHIPTGSANSLVSHNGDTPPYAWVWDFNENHLWGTTFPGDHMIRYKGSDYYYCIVDENFKGLVLSKDTGDTGKTYQKYNTKDYIIRSNKTAWKSPYYVIEPTSRTTFKTISLVREAPSLEIPYVEPDITTDLNMAYVGGNKVRVVNKSYVNILGDGKITNDYTVPVTSGNKFGGSNINKNSGGRVGGSELIPYYDWYEYMLPIAKASNYTFSIEGMNPGNASKQTKQIVNAYGDVWLEQLDNTTLKDGKYSNINLLTFDPEYSQTASKITVYFRLPSGWDNLKLKAYGMEDVEKTPNGTLTRGNNANIRYFNDISKNTPFITFTVDETLANGTKVSHSYKTSLHGGDEVLFDPRLRDGYGNWTTFVSDQENLKRVLKELMAMYYGKVIVKQYNDNGEVYSHGDSTYNYSEYLRSRFESYATYTTSNGVKYYILNDVSGISEAAAYSAYVDISNVIANYGELYQQISNAKEYIDGPLTNGEMSAWGQPEVHITDSKGHYPEYLGRGNTYIQYSRETLTALRRRLAEAEGAYLSLSSSNVVKAAVNIKRAIASLSTEDKGAISCFLYDAQGKVRAGSSFKIRYKKPGQDYYTTDPVPDKNDENFPMIQIPHEGANFKISEVQFIETTVGGEEYYLGTPRTEMKAGEEWVFVDTSNNSFWTPNTESDYRQINSDLFMQEDAADQMIYEMERNDTTAKFETMTLLYNTNTTITLADGSSYVIKAGAYVFTHEDTQDSSSVVYGGTLNVFSTKAKAYFTDPANYGEYTENAIDASTLGWIVEENEKLNFKTGNNTSSGNNVNFTANSGSFTKYTNYYSYSSTDGFYFRWDKASPLYVNKEVRFWADDFRFATSGTIDGTKDDMVSPHFYLYNNDPSVTEMKITFVSNVAVHYYDNMHNEHSFVIGEGEWTIKKDPNDGGDYIADLFNETYWKGGEYAIQKGRSGSSFTSTGDGKLVHGSYS